MLEILSRSLGFVSASVVALIALGFGAMFLFFLGLAALLLGHFLRFVSRPRVAVPAIVASAALVAFAAWQLGAPVWWHPALAQGTSSSVAWAVIALLAAAPALRRPLAFGFGGILLLCGVTFVTSLLVTTLGRFGMEAAALAGLFIMLPAVGLWPLVIAGLIEHRRTKKVEWYIGLRYLVARRRQTFISIISVICVVGVALGVSVITVVLSVMNGFSYMWEEKVIGARAHFSVLSRTGDVPNYRELTTLIGGPGGGGGPGAMPGVVGATPYLATDAILRGHDGGLQAIMLKGIDPATVGNATQLLQTIKAGSVDDLPPKPDGDE